MAKTIPGNDAGAPTSFLASRPSTAPRLVSGIAGALSAGAALYVLVGEAAASGTWTLDTALAPVTVGLTIASGHLLGAAISDRRWISALGFALLFTVGTALTIYASVGRQAEATGTTALAAESLRLQRASVMNSLTRNQAMLAEAQKKLGIECATGDGPACKGIKAAIGVYQDAITGNLARLRDLGPEKATNGAATRLAEIVSMLGGNGEHTMKLAVMLEPFMRTLLLELGAIVCFGFAFSGHRQLPQKTSPQISGVPTKSKPKHVSDRVSVNESNGASALDAVNAWVLDLAVGERITFRQRDLAARLGISQPHVSRCLNALKAAGNITMASGKTGTQVSRCAEQKLIARH